MIEVTERVIGGRRYRITPHGAKAGKRVLTRLVALVGGPLGQLATTDIGGAIAAFVKGADAATLDYFYDEFLPKTIVEYEGNEVQLSLIADDLYARNYGEMLEWLIACFEVNFADFFVVARSRTSALIETAIAQAMDRMKASRGSVSRMVATGASTESQSAGSTKTPS
jgi:hypothetical protein